MKNKYGFALIEMIIYVAILGLVSVFVINSILVAAKALNSNKVTRSINTAAESSMERITREIKKANDIASGGVFGVHPGSLKLDSVDLITEDSLAVEIFVSGDQLMIKEGYEAAVSLISSDIVLNKLVFYEVASTTNILSRAVRIEIEFQGGSGDYQKVKKFYNTAILRASY